MLLPPVILEGFREKIAIQSRDPSRMTGGDGELVRLTLFRT